MPVEVKGLEQALKALRKISPELYKEMNKQIKPELRLLVSASRANIPNSFEGLSNWKTYSTLTGKFPPFNPANVKSSYHFSIGKRKTYGSRWSNRYTVYTTSPAGAIIEFAGVTNPQGQPWVGKHGKSGHKYSHSNNPKAGQHFISSIAAKNKAVKIGKNAGRVMYKALFDNNGQAKKVAVAAINNALMSVGFKK